MWPQSGLPSVPGWNAGNGDHTQSGSQDWANYYQSMPANQVDWGSLAQQWIAMKTENTLPAPIFDDTEPPPPAPGEEHFTPQPSIPVPTYAQWPPIHLPPPNIHGSEKSTHHDEAPPLPPVPPLPSTPHPNSQPEGGVVDMDMDDEDDQAASTTGNNDWSVRPSSNSKTNISGDGYYKKQNEVSNTTKGVNTGNRGEYQRPSFGGPSPHPPGGGWIHKNNQGAGRGINNPNMAQIPPLMGLSSNSVNMIENSSAYSSHSYSTQGMIGSMANLDAAARKKLPPWIREGLEKMEREKLKKEEELMRKQIREEKLRKRREEELKMNERRKQDPGISKFDDMNSNSESDDDTNGYSTPSKASDLFKKEINIEQEANGKSSDGNIISQRKRPSRFDEKDLSGNRNNDGDDIKQDDNIKVLKEIPKKHLTKDEILEEMSLILKRTLTEILLEVTSEEIQATAEESLASAQRQKSKSVVNAKIRANRAFKKNPISSLGLTGYGSGTDDSASESDKSDKKSEDNNTSDSDSDVELEERLKQRKRQFQRMETSILDECADLEKSLEKREKIWKEKESDSARRRHESKSSNHSDHSDNRKNSPKVFETFSAAVNVLPSASDCSETKSSRFDTDENKIHSKQILIPSASQSKVKDSSMRLDTIHSENPYSSDEDKAPYGNEKNSHLKIKEKQKIRDLSTSPEEKHRSNRKHRHDSSRKERSKRSPSDTNDSERSERVHKSKRRSRSKEKPSKRSRSPKTSKHQRHSRSRSRSRNRSEKKSSRRDRHRSRSKERKSREESKSSSSRRKRSTSRDIRKSRRSRSRSTDNRRPRRHSSSSSEASTFSYASGNGNYSRRERRESQMSSSRKTHRRSRS